MLLMGPSLTLITVDTKWQLIRYYTPGALAGIQKSIPNLIPFANSAPPTLTTAAQLLKQIIRLGLLVTPRESINA
jgi:hypothetical protein